MQFPSFTVVLALFGLLASQAVAQQVKPANTQCSIGVQFLHSGVRKKAWRMLGWGQRWLLQEPLWSKLPLHFLEDESLG
ncbi:hypothetical protein Landi51_01486 [Colletotrichum acutatum]